MLLNARPSVTLSNDTDKGKPICSEKIASKTTLRQILRNLGWN
jgi:hypothetical protein